MQDVYRFRETGRFFSKQEPCNLPAVEAVFHGHKQGTPGFLGGVLTCAIFLKKSFGTVNEIFVLSILRLESDSDVQNT